MLGGYFFLFLAMCKVVVQSMAGNLSSKNPVSRNAGVHWGSRNQRTE